MSAEVKQVFPCGPDDSSDHGATVFICRYLRKGYWYSHNTQAYSLDRLVLMTLDIECEKKLYFQIHCEE